MSHRLASLTTSLNNERIDFTVKFSSFRWRTRKLWRFSSSMLVVNASLTTTAMSSSPVDRMSGASTPTLLAMSSIASNRLHEELIGLKRWRQMYDSAMTEKVVSLNLSRIFHFFKSRSERRITKTSSGQSTTNSGAQRFDRKIKIENNERNFFSKFLFKAQIEQQTMTINSMKQNEMSLEKKFDNISAV